MASKPETRFNPFQMATKVFVENTLQGRHIECQPYGKNAAIKITFGMISGSEISTLIRSYSVMFHNGGLVVGTATWEY